MLKTALLTIQEFCYRINIPAPTVIIGGTSPGDLQLIHTLYDVCEDMRRSGPFRPQILQHEFDTVASRATYPLPGDFFEAVPYTQYNQDQDHYSMIRP